jgi:hypothetical protein
MGKMRRLLWSVGALTALGPAVAWADGFQSYHVCGGNAFNTCAAVQIQVVGKDVTVNLWNLSGSTTANFGTQSSGNTILNGIGFYNLPPGLKIRPKTVTVTGPARSGDEPGAWKFRNKGTAAFPVGIFGNRRSGVNNSIANGCATSLPKNRQLFENQGCGQPSNGGWVTYHFKIRGSWDPTKSDIVLRGVQVQQGRKGRLTKIASECWTGTGPDGARANCINTTPGEPPPTVTPEPVTMTLLATGLAGVGGVGFFRRRKKGNQAT